MRRTFSTLALLLVALLTACAPSANYTEYRKDFRLLLVSIDWFGVHYQKFEQAMAASIIYDRSPELQAKMKKQDEEADNNYEKVKREIAEFDAKYRDQFRDRPSFKALLELDKQITNVSLAVIANQSAAQQVATERLPSVEEEKIAEDEKSLGDPRRPAAIPRRPAPDPRLVESRKSIEDARQLFWSKDGEIVKLLDEGH